MAERGAAHPIAALIARELELRASTTTPLGAQLGTLVSLARDRALPAGSMIYARGAPSDRIFTIVEGEVELRGGPRPWRAGAGTSIGVLDVLIGRPFARTAMTRSHARMIEVSTVDFEDFLQASTESVQQMIGQFAAAITRRLLAANEPAALVAVGARGQPAIGRGASTTLLDRLFLLRQVPALATASVEALANLARAARHVRVDAGAVVATSGSATDLISVLVRGRLALHHPDLAGELTSEAIDLAAHADELVGGSRLLSAVACGDAELLQLEREELLDRLEDHFELVRSILRYLALVQERINDDLSLRGQAL